jgi:hypothetical protein
MTRTKDRQQNHDRPWRGKLFIRRWLVIGFIWGN